MIKSLHNPAKGKLRVMGYCSGSGNTLWKVLELQREMEKTFEGSPFEIVGMFSDNPESKAVKFAQQENIPYAAIDIREFYKENNAPLKDRDVRVKYDKAALELIKEFKADIVLLAGYVWATTDVILDNYQVLNVHPGDLSITRDNQRVLAGHNGVKAAFDEKMDYLASSSHLGTKELDAGPILMISENVDVDYTLHDNEEDRFRHYLKLVNNQSRLLGARTILEIALGNFQVDSYGKVYYKNEKMPKGYKVENWNTNIPRYERNMDKLIKPKSIAVIGASNRPGIGYAIVKNLMDIKFPGAVYAVNTRGEDVLGAKGAKSVLDINEDIDMAVIAVPSPAVLSVAEECGKKGIKGIVCISAGFKEVGDEGVEKEKELMTIVDNYNMRLIGPNCMGIANTDDTVKMSSTILSDVPPKGNIAFVTQSGALGASMMDFAEGFGIGFSIIVSLGNQADVNVNDLLPILEEDDNTKVILLYMESIVDPYRFLANMEKVTKPVVIIKSGRTTAGALAASSHTGSLASNDRITDVFIKKSGAIRVETLEDAFLVATTISKIGTVKGNRIGVVTNAGGLGILTADSLDKYGFVLPPTTEKVREDLKSLLFPEASINNPLDLVAPAPPIHYVYATQAMIDSNEYDAIIINCVPPATIDTGDVAAALVQTLKDSPIPVLSCFFAPTLGAPANEVMLKAGIPTFDYPEKLVRIMSYIREEEKEVKAKDSKISHDIDIEACNNIIKQYKDGGFMSVQDQIQLLDNYGIKMAKSGYISKDEDISALGLDYPVVAKIDHKDIIHKSDVGGVELNIKDAKALKELFDKWKEKFKGLTGVFVQEQIASGIEIITGSTYDEVLGHSIILGLGGTLVELLEDISFGHVPLAENDIINMIDSLKSKELLYGYRGEEGVDIDGLVEIVGKLNLMLLNHPEIQECDINPLIFNKESKKFIGVDSRIKIRD